MVGKKKKKKKRFRLLFNFLSVPLWLPTSTFVIYYMVKIETTGSKTASESNIMQNMEVLVCNEGQNVFILMCSYFILDILK